MKKTKLKNGGKRAKALFGADGAIMAAATLTAAGMTTAATIKAANEQAKSITESAKTQAQAIEQQNINNNNLQTESLNFTRQQNAENRQQQQDIQTTLQMLTGQQNMNDIMEQNKVQVKMGGRPKRRKLKSDTSYGGANNLFKVTDGGGVVPIQVDENGYGLYELYGNDHEHYHKAPGGKMKTGVGIRFANGGVVEGEGNQGTNQGELMYVTPNDAVFISKHSIRGFNPAQAVDDGMHPEQAFAYQEAIKDAYGIPDDGKKAKCGKRKSIKRAYGGQQILFDTANMTQNPNNGTAPTSAGVVYAINNTISPVENTRQYKLKYGGRRKALYGSVNVIPSGISVSPQSVYTGQLATAPTIASAAGAAGGSGGSSFSKFMDSPYGGATMASIGNILGAGLNVFGNLYSSNKLGKAYTRAGNMLADAYSQLKGINLGDISREDYAAAHAMANVRYANLNNNAVLERIRRDNAAQSRVINQTNLSDAARNIKLAATTDRSRQRMSEAYADINNQNERIKQENLNIINQVAQFNAQQDNQARQDYSRTMLQAMMYNNDIENSKIMGAAQARADALTQRATLAGNAWQNSANSLASAIGGTGNAFASAWNADRNYNMNYRNALLGFDMGSQVVSVINSNDKQAAMGIYEQQLDILAQDPNNAIAKSRAERLKKHFNFA